MASKESVMERCTDRVREAMKLAQEEATGMGHNFIGTEHLLIALMRVDGVATNLLKSHGIESTDSLRCEIMDLLCDQMDAEYRKN